MNTISYTIDLFDGQTKTGQSSRIFIKDAINVLTIGNMHAPLITVLENGVIQVSKDGVLAFEVPYVEGFLTCRHNHCDIRLLK